MKVMGDPLKLTLFLWPTTNLQGNAVSGEEKNEQVTNNWHNVEIISGMTNSICIASFHRSTNWLSSLKPTLFQGEYMGDNKILYFSCMPGPPKNWTFITIAQCLIKSQKRIQAAR